MSGTWLEGQSELESLDFGEEGMGVGGVVHKGIIEEVAFL